MGLPALQLPKEVSILKAMLEEERLAAIKPPRLESTYALDVASISGELQKAGPGVALAGTLYAYLRTLDSTCRGCAKCSQLGVLCLILPCAGSMSSPTASSSLGSEQSMVSRGAFSETLPSSSSSWPRRMTKLFTCSSESQALPLDSDDAVTSPKD